MTNIFKLPKQEEAQAVLEAYPFIYAPAVDLTEIAYCKAWIMATPGCSEHLNPLPSSYAYKHAVEQWVGEQFTTYNYISNASFIVAAVLCHYYLFKPKKATDLSPNAHFSKAPAVKGLRRLYPVDTKETQNAK